MIKEIKYYKILLGVCFFACWCSFAQQVDDPKLLNEIPPSPTMWEFAKYGNYPVSLHTGVPNISIPIFKVGSGNIEVPISLNYHASGIKVEQRASNVGLGWVLNAGGAITRVVKGGVDENNNGFINRAFDDNYSVETNSGALSESILYGEIDTQPDMFYYDFMGYSGKFIFSSSTGKVNPIISLIPHADLKITPIFFGQDIVAFKIITPEGITAEFGNPERSDLSFSTSERSYYRAANTTWHLKTLTSHDLIDVISFEYDKISEDSFTRDTRYSDSYSVLFNDPCNIGNHESPLRSTKNIGTIFWNASQLSRITTKNGYVIFNNTKNNRLDDLYNEVLRLDNIRYYSVMSEVSTLVKGFDLEYGYLSESLEPRLKLTKLHHVDNKNERDNSYAFYYEEKNELPKRSSRSQDYWGYYNGKGNRTLTPKVTINLGNVSFVGDADRKPYAGFTQAGILKKIAFPTKGYTLFEYENNDCTVGTDNEQHIAGGLRIKSITGKNYNDKTEWVKSYEYTRQDNPLLSSGVYNGNSFVTARDYLSITDSYFNSTKVGTCPPRIFAITYKNTNYSVASSPAVDKNFASVFYSQVKEYNGTPDNHQGYTWYYFDSRKDLNLQANGPASIRIDKSWDRGQLTKQETFANSVDNPIQIDSMGYDVVYPSSSVKGFILDTFYDVPHYLFEPVPPFQFPTNRFSILYYSEVVPWKILSQSTTTKDGITTTQNFEYDKTFKHTNLKKSITTTSIDSEKLITEMFYPDDVIDKSSLGLPNLSEKSKFAIDKLKKNYLHRTTEPLQKIVIKEKNGVVVARSMDRTSYTDFGNYQILPDTLKTLKGFHSDNNSIQNRVVYHNYDGENNPIEVSKADGSNIYYIWGYEKQYPIAKIENFSSDKITPVIQNIIEEAVAASDEDYTKIDEENLLAKLKNLRESLNTLNVLTTTYTYDPHIGMTSSTDTKGYTTKYLYDNLNRLVAVKDSDGNLLSEQYYNYKNESN